jgi:hypothetical protein
VGSRGAIALGHECAVQYDDDGAGAASVLSCFWPMCYVEHGPSQSCVSGHQGASYQSQSVVVHFFFLPPSLS